VFVEALGELSEHPVILVIDLCLELQLFKLTDVEAEEPLVRDDVQWVQSVQILTKKEEGRGPISSRLVVHADLVDLAHTLLYLTENKGNLLSQLPRRGKLLN